MGLSKEAERDFVERLEFIDRYHALLETYQPDSFDWEWWSQARFLRSVRTQFRRRFYCEKHSR